MDPRSILGLPAVYELFGALLGRDESSRRFVRAFVRPARRARVLDIGCGPGVLFPYLPPDVEYVGYDERLAYIENASRKYGPRARFYCGRIGEFRAPKSFDVALAVGVLHHLSDDQVRDLFRTAKESLGPSGRLITLDGALVEGQSPIARFLIALDRGRHVRAPRAYEALAREYFPCVHATLTHDLLRIPYTHFIMECSVGACY